MSKTYGQSTKESYRDDIEISRKHKTVYKIFEWLDDHSYCNTDEMGIYIHMEEDEIFIYLFQNDGPRDIETLKKFLEWRRSGKSTEIGHKGGGNKRNIYGYKCEEANIIMKVDEKNVIRCGTKPNKLYDLAISDVDEETFRNESDSSTYIINPEQIKIKNLPSWYEQIYGKICNESGIEPNFMIRLELPNISEIPEEYTDKNLWTEYIHQIRAKQYNVIIKFKNELLEMENYESYDNIDLVGLNDSNKVKLQKHTLYIDSKTLNFYLKCSDKLVDVKSKKEVEDSDDIIVWGEILMFIVTADYIAEELRKYNEFNENTKRQEITKRQEDFYGVYLLLNGKLTNYLPFEGKVLGDSRNNGINCEQPHKNNGRFRMIFIPNKGNCDNKIFDSLIQTREIKALTGFLENSPHKAIASSAMKLYKDGDIKKKPVKKKCSSSKPSKNGDTKTHKKIKSVDYGIYLTYLNYGLWKYSIISDYNNIDAKNLYDKHNSIESIKKYKDHLNCDVIPKKNKCIVIYENMISPITEETIHGLHERFKCLIEQNKLDKIKFIETLHEGVDISEYFVCNDFDYVYNNINGLFQSVIEN